MTHLLKETTALISLALFIAMIGLWADILTLVR